MTEHIQYNTIANYKNHLFLLEVMCGDSTKYCVENSPHLDTEEQVTLFDSLFDAIDDFIDYIYRIEG